MFQSKIRPLSRSVDAIRVQYQIQTADGSEIRCETVGELIKRAKKSHKQFMERMDDLLKEWDKLGIEVSEVTSGGDGGGPMDADGEEETEKEMKEIQKEIELITEAAMVCSREIEKVSNYIQSIRESRDGG